MSVQTYLQKFKARFEKKAFLQIIMRGWERQTGILVEDTSERLVLRFVQGYMEVVAWQEGEPLDLLIRGTERDLLLYFSGNELSYLYAKERIELKGPVRDQLKVDALLRLTAEEAVSA